MATKRKVEMIVPAEESDQLLIRPLWVHFVFYMNTGFEWLLLYLTTITINTILNAVFSCNYRGAGQEVGRSCIILEFKGRKIMVNIFVFALIIYDDIKL